MKITEEQALWAKEQIESGQKLSYIAEKLGMSRNGLSNRIRKIGAVKKTLVCPEDVLHNPNVTITGPGCLITDVMWAWAKEKLENGYSMRAVASALYVSPNTILNTVKRRGGYTVKKPEWNPDKSIKKE